MMKKKMISQERTNKVQQEISQDGLVLLAADLGRATKSLLREMLVFSEEAALLILELLNKSLNKQSRLQPVLLEAQRKGGKHHEERNLKTNKLNY
jgi:hypothetical protein